MNPTQQLLMGVFVDQAGSDAEANAHMLTTMLNALTPVRAVILGPDVLLESAARHHHEVIQLINDTREKLIDHYHQEPAVLRIPNQPPYMTIESDSDDDAESSDDGSVQERVLIAEEVFAVPADEEATAEAALDAALMKRIATRAAASAAAARVVVGDEADRVAAVQRRALLSDAMQAEAEAQVEAEAAETAVTEDYYARWAADLTEEIRLRS